MSSYVVVQDTGEQDLSHLTYKIYGLFESKDILGFKELARPTIRDELELGITRPNPSVAHSSPLIF